VRTLGSGGGIDKPAGVWPELSMKWMPVYNKSCVLCKPRTAVGDIPYCVYSCPYEALSYGDLSDSSSAASKNLADLETKGYSIFKLPEWENSKEEVVYASSK
jgi:Fe-S-cluster-containing dehydrogenase component